jgi:hypothetical protein
VTAENSQFDKVPTRRFLKLTFPAEPMDSLLAALMTLLAKSDHEHFVLGYSLVVQVDDVVVMLCLSAAHAIWMLSREPVTVTALGSGQNGTSSSRSA